jgi:hypothetical protein
MYTNPTRYVYNNDFINRQGENLIGLYNFFQSGQYYKLNVFTHLLSISLTLVLYRDVFDIKVSKQMLRSLVINHRTTMTQNLKEGGELGFFSLSLSIEAKVTCYAPLTLF